MQLRTPDSGVDAFIAYLGRQAAVATPDWPGAVWFMLRIGEDCANIRLQDIWQPSRFLRQMAGAPPLRFDPGGFKTGLVDDRNPARHYVAFVLVGFWLPKRLALLLLYAWEVAGFVRYRGLWSQNDVACGHVGLRHGNLVRRYGATILPALVAADLAAKSNTVQLLTPDRRDPHR